MSYRDHSGQQYGQYPATARAAISSRDRQGQHPAPALKAISKGHPYEQQPAPALTANSTGHPYGQQPAPDLTSRSSRYNMGNTNLITSRVRSSAPPTYGSSSGITRHSRASICDSSRQEEHILEQGATAVQTMLRTPDGTSPIPNKMGRRIPYPGGTSSPSSGTQEMALKHIRACAPKFTPRFYDMHGNIQAKECDRREGSTGFCEKESTSSNSNSQGNTANSPIGLAQRHTTKGHGEDQGWGQRTLAQDKDQGQGASLFSQYHLQGSVLSTLRFACTILTPARIRTIYASLQRFPTSGSPPQSGPASPPAKSVNLDLPISTQYAGQHNYSADSNGTTCFFRTYAGTTLSVIFPRGMREDPEATTTAWPRPRIEDGKFKLSEAWGASPANPRAALTRAGTPPGGRGPAKRETRARAPGTNQRPT